MEIKLFNSLSNKVEVFHPLKEKEISIYCCGPTVYNDPHIGNIRPPLVFDTLRRFFEYLDYEVKYVSNYTDVDDKIINKALEEGVSEKEISDRYIKAYRDVLDKLNVLPQYKNPRVTEYINDIIEYIADLVKDGAAYEKDGNVYFKVASVPDYGVLSNINKEDLVVGSRIEENSEKENPLDFVLWKKTDKGIKWNSPWGEGRPGWHTECCVMINSIFKGLIDIHGGGFDLKFPHHENEIAQEKAHDHRNIANFWMHNGFVNLDDQKMSKSLGNVILAKDAIEQYGGNLLRLIIISTYYRAPVSLTEQSIQSARSELEKISKAYNQAAVALQLNNVSLDFKTTKIEPFLNCLANDFNTSNALTYLYSVVKELNIELRKNPLDLVNIQNDFACLKDMLNILGLKLSYSILNDELKNIYNAYLEAKKEKNFAKSDELRKILIENKVL